MQKGRLTPVQVFLDSLEWTPVENDARPVNDGVPYVTHQGEFKVGEDTFKVYQLSDGQRVIDAGDVEDFFGVAVTIVPADVETI
jgi:hypothetical protein